MWIYARTVSYPPYDSCCVLFILLLLFFLLRNGPTHAPYRHTHMCRAGLCNKSCLKKESMTSFFFKSLSGPKIFLRGHAKLLACFCFFQNHALFLSPRAFSQIELKFKTQVHI